MPATATTSHRRATRRRCRSANRVMVIMRVRPPRGGRFNSTEATLGAGSRARNAPREEHRRPPAGGCGSSCRCDSEAPGGRYPRSAMHAPDTRSWTPRDVVVALVAFALTLGLLANGHGSTRGIDVPGVALAALACLPLVAHRRAPLGVFALTTAASAAINALGYQGGPRSGRRSRSSTVANDDRTRSQVGRTAAVVFGMFAVHLGRDGDLRGRVPDDADPVRRRRLGRGLGGRRRAARPPPAPGRRGRTGRPGRA